MRIDKALENIRAVMESQEIEWLNENGYDPTPHKPEPRRPSAPKKALSGHFAPNRFLGTAPLEPQEPEEYEEPEEHEEPQEPIEPQEPEIQTPDNEPEIIEVIKQQDGTKHSWLYNEVVKAIHDASGDGRNTKVIAIFIPLVQNGKEFEDLPVSETIELSPVEDEAMKLEEIPVIVEESVESAEDLPEAEPAENVDELLPEPIPEPDKELAQAFSVMEAKLDEHIAAINDEAQESEQEEEAEPEVIPEPEEAPEQEHDADIAPNDVAEIQEVAADVEDLPDEFSAGEVMEFTELPDIPLPNELDDEEVLNENNNENNN